ncbi:uncharacterized protein YALI1_D26454g [Yarrowia lipolytica]|uniref:Uncharacterized protein n=1 Tax=Yarrowia lipolytica TaxID=4952 RepID=A0A1D8NFG9_YARLL|nr:hypothetical protein YALI1_D26454g [Yarrowia lipolytica]
MAISGMLMGTQTRASLGGVGYRESYRLIQNSSWPSFSIIYASVEVKSSTVQVGGYILALVLVLQLAAKSENSWATESCLDWSTDMWLECR